jgi:proteic killer suppression protein
MGTYPASSGGLRGQHLTGGKTARTPSPLAAAKINQVSAENLVAYLDAMEDPEELRALAAWKAHTLTGDRKGTWSLSVTRNLRLTFRIDAGEGEICDLNIEDYH